MLLYFYTAFQPQYPYKVYAYVFKIVKKNINFYATVFCLCLDAVRKREKRATEESVLAALQAVLKQAPYRKGGTMEKQRKSRSSKNKQDEVEKEKEIENTQEEEETEDTSDEEKDDETDDKTPSYKRKRCISSDSDY